MRNFPASRPSKHSMRGVPTRPWRRGVFVVLAALVVGLPARGAAEGTASNAPILHEYVPFDPASESDLGVVTTEGGFKAEVVTSSGKITAPDPGRPIGDKTPLYGAKPSVESERYVPDRDVRRPDHLTYDDPFRPSLAPFKRLAAFDGVRADYSLEVRDPSRKLVTPGKDPAATTNVDTFYADVAVTLRAGEPVRIPNVIAGTGVKLAHANPSTMGFRLERDGAENLFIVGAGAGTVRLILELEAPREAFGGERSVSWSDLELVPGGLPKLPANVQKAADEIARELKIDRSTHMPRDATQTLVRYFREFADSETPPPNTGDVYLDVTRSKKGVCRHRSFAFMITALGLGIPTRFVHNEAHAWVEVWDGTLWRRIDLGGAGRVLDDVSEKPERPQPRHEPPSDPYAWPPGATKGSDMVPPAAPIPSPTPTNTGSPTPVPSTPPTGSVAPSNAPPSKVTLSISGASDDPLEIVRSKSLAVKGRVVDSSGAPCKEVIVNIKLVHTKSEHTLGALTTDAKGEFDGAVTPKSDLPLGEYSVVAQTPGNASCGQGVSE